MTSGVAGENSDENDSGNGDDVTMRSEHVAKPAPAVAKEPANGMPIRYLNGKRVSEYEWIRSENIKANKKLLNELELKNAVGRIFGERDGKENKENGGEPSTKLKKIPQENATTRTLRSMGKAVMNRCVYM
jgi:hypothetical protein